MLNEPKIPTGGARLEVSVDYTELFCVLLVTEPKLIKQILLLHKRNRITVHGDLTVFDALVPPQ